MRYSRFWAVALDFTPDFASLEQCIQLREDIIVQAVGSSAAMNALLARFEQIAAPKKGAPTILLALARMGTTAVDWVDGELIIQMTGDDTKTKISVLSDLGGGLREKVLKDVSLRVPLDEFVRAINKTPKMIAPLVTREIGKRIVLSATQEIRKTSLPPPSIEVDVSAFVAAAPRLPVIETPKGSPPPPPLPQSAAARARPATLPQGALPKIQKRAPSPTGPEPALALRTPPNPILVAIAEGPKSARTPAAPAAPAPKPPPPPAAKAPPPLPAGKPAVPAAKPAAAGSAPQAPAAAPPAEGKPRPQPPRPTIAKKISVKKEE